MGRLVDIIIEGGGIVVSGLGGSCATANNAKQRTVSSVQEDTINYEQAQNGLNINREERLKLDEIRKTISFDKKKS